MNNEPFDRTRWLPFFIMAVILIILYNAIGNLAPIAAAVERFVRVISPLLYGILVTYFLYVPHKYLEKLLKKVKIRKFTFISTHARGLSSVLLLILLIALVALVSAFVVPIIASSIADLVNSIPGYAQEVLAFFDSIPSDSIFAAFDISQWLQDITGALINSLLNTQGIEQAVMGVMNFAGGVFNFLLGIVLALYILVYRDEIREYLNRINNAVIKNEHRRGRAAKYTNLINHVLLTFIGSKSIDALCNFAAATIITTVFGVPYSLLLGLIAGLFNFIPYIGSIVSSLIIALIAFLTCSIPVALAVTACIFAFQQLDGNLIEPKIMNASLKINPILVIMAVTVGGAYFGIAGMFLGVPVAVIIKEILQEYMSTSELAAASRDDAKR